MKWRVFCEKCTWNADNVDSRDRCIRLGKDHIRKCENSKDDYKFRIQGVRVN